MNKTLKVPFEVFIRNKKTKEEMKICDMNVPIKISIDKKQLHKIMKDNLVKEDKSDEQEE